MRSAADSIWPADAIARWLDRLSPSTRVVFTCGCFDLLHAGHVATLEWARAQGDFLVVGISSDASIRGQKGSLRPVIRQAERAYLVAALRCVDFVTIYDEDTPEALMRQLGRLDVMVKGPEYQGREGSLPGVDLVRRVLIAPESCQSHTSDIVRLIKERI